MADEPTQDNTTNTEQGEKSTDAGMSVAGEASNTDTSAPSNTTPLDRIEHALSHLRTKLGLGVHWTVTEIEQAVAELRAAV